MKKVGIITQSLITNYGGILQNFALQHVVKSLGYEVETINRVEKYSEFNFLLRKIKQKLFKHHSNKILSNSQQIEIAKLSSEFIIKYINKIDIVNPTKEKLTSICENKKYSSIIVGSDQVWRPRYAINIFNDFFDFLEGNKNTAKIAYAASFGTDSWEFNSFQTERCSALAKQIDAVSVREKSAINLCNEYLGIEATFVLDPTLLVEKEVYLSLIENSNSRRRENAGLYTYVLDSSKDKKDIIEKISVLKKLNVFSNQPKKVYLGTSQEKYLLEDYQYPSIEGWLEGFKNANFIVTDSFHGTVFSIIFNKPFLAIVNEGRGKARFESLLQLFGLENRLISSIDEVNDSLLEEDIDFNSVNEKREELKKMSINFLKNNVQ